MAAYTTFKLTPADYQALVALLQYLCGQLNVLDLMAILRSQGRPYAEGTAADRLVPLAAEMLLRSVR